MDNEDVQGFLETIENEKIPLIALNKNKAKENNYLIDDFDLDDEFDVIRSIN